MLELIEPPSQVSIGLLPTIELHDTTGDRRHHARRTGGHLEIDTAASSGIGISHSEFVLLKGTANLWERIVECHLQPVIYVRLAGMPVMERSRDPDT